MLAQEVVSLLRCIALELKFLIEARNYKCRFAKNVDVVNELHHSSLESFENNISHKVFNFHVMYEVNIEDFQTHSRAIDKVDVT